MSNIQNSAVTKVGNAFTGTTNWNDPDRATIYAGDVSQPWKSVYGFPTTAARLATGRELVLHCREDEIIELMEGLNELLESPESLNRAYRMLKKLQQQTKQKLARLIALRDQPIAEDEISNLMADVEQLFTESQEQTPANRLTCILSPNHAVQEIAGTAKMVTRLQKLVTAMDKVKDEGFHVTVRDKRRKPMRPALEAKRNEAVGENGQSDSLPAGFLMPTNYHLTLWTYLVARGDAGQSAIWN